MAEAHAATMACTNTLGVLLGRGPLRHDDMTDVLVQQVQTADLQPLGQEGRMLGVVIDDGARSLQW